MLQPEDLKKNELLTWSPGRGTDVWGMFCACIADDLPAIERLVGRDPSLINCHFGYRTPLYFAVRENRISIVSYLLERGADPLKYAFGDTLLDICNDRGYDELRQLLEAAYATNLNASPAGESLAAAIRAHDLPKVRMLLDADPALLHSGDARSNQPIHWAAMTRQLDVIDELLARGADINAIRQDGASPLQLANGDYHFRGWRDVAADWPTKPAQVVDHLRARGAYCDICTACYLGDINRVRELLGEDPSLANRTAKYVTYYLGSGTPLKNAAANGHLEIVRLLLDHGTDPNLREEEIAPHGHALYSAVANKHYEIAKLLLERGAYPNPPVESSADALSRAISNNDQPMIDLLCSYGAARELHILAYYGDVQTAAAMLVANPKSAEDPVALANAAGEQQEAFMRLLLRFVPDLPKRVQFPAWSVGAKRRELNELLFQHGMVPSQPDWLMITPLHFFAGNGDIEQGEQFIDRGANLTARDEALCSTPLGWAAKSGQKAMVELLLRRGAPTNLPDDPPWATPLAWAARRGHGEIADLLRRHGAT